MGRGDLSRAGVGMEGGHRHIHRSRLRLLLASSSVAALLVGGGAPAAYAGCSASPNNHGNTTCIDIVNSSIAGNVTNTGTGVITATGNAAPTRTGITINNSTIGGAVVNAGQIASGVSGNGILVTNDAIVVGGISNNGTIAAAFNGIFVGGTALAGTSTTVATFAGGISNFGTISNVGANGIVVGGKATGSNASVSVSNFSGGISNIGKITAGHGIVVGGLASGTNVTVSVGNFTGGVTNSGKITALTGDGILVGGVAEGRSGTTVSISNFSGGISNGGTIAALTPFGHGIVVGGTALGASIDISTFSGGITNSGKIIAGFSGNGIFLGGQAEGFGASVAISTFSGGISNQGTIAAGLNGILAGGQAIGPDASVAISTLSGGITNSGKIAGSGNGIFVGGGAESAASLTISTFSGGISNSGTILAGVNGIFVGGTAEVLGSVAISNFSGGITNSSTIVGGTGNGIIVGGRAAIFGASVSVSDFSGGISNGGTITAGHGIVVGGLASGFLVSVSVSNFTGGITNSGTIAAVAHSGHGIFVGGVASHTGANVSIGNFGGGISNSGLISARDNGVFVGGFAGSGASLLISNFTNGITNSGTITARGNGIVVGGTAVSGSSLTISNLANGIVNNGLISARGAGIEVGGTAAAFSSVVISTFSGGITNSGTITVSASNSAGIFVGGSAHGHSQFAFSTFSGGITNAGTITAGTAGFGVQVLNVSSFLDGITNVGSISAGTGIAVTNAGAVSVFDAGFIAGSSGTAVDLSHTGPDNTFTLGSGYGFGAGTELVIGSGSDTFQLGGAATGAFDLSKIGTQFIGFTTFNVVGATWLADGTSNQNWTVFNGATLELVDGSGGAANGTVNGNVVDNGTFAINRTDTYTYAGTITGSGSFVQMGSGITVLSGNNTYTGGTVVRGGTLTFSGAGTLGAATGTTTVDAGGTLDLGGTTQTQAVVNLAGGTIQNGNLDAALNSTGGLINGIGGTASVTVTAGTTLVEGINSYAGVTNINGGTLDVIGSILDSAGVTVNAGGTLTGPGIVDPPGTVTIMSSGALAPGTAGVPGTSMTIAGNLAFQSGALYVVYLNGTTSTFANITGTPALAGTVEAMLLPGTSVGHYTILESSGLNGTTFAGLMTPGTPNFRGSLSYTPDDVLLNLTAALGLGTPLNENQQNVATTLNNVFNATGTLPANFLPLYNLAGPPLAKALSQLDGEDATGAEHSAFELTNEFLEVMLDPFVYGRGGAASGGGPLGFAPDQQASFPSDVALAYASILKAPPQRSFDQRWTVWGASFGGSGTFSGDPVVGSSNITASTYGFAAGADYHVSADTVLGFAAAGSGTNWSLAQSLGTGRSDAFQAGVYGTKYFGPAYLSAAFAFTNNWFTTNRIAAAGDQLTASFNGQSLGVRVESGYRYAVASAAGVTPYAAIQAQDFHTPTYSETDLTGGGFGLTYNAMTATDTRSELGARFDALTAWGAIPVQLRARLAWAHDWVSNPALDAAFQSLPGSSFVVNGAAVPANSALTSLGAELHLTPRWTMIGKFDGEFASSAQTYAGSGTLRYQW